MTENVTDAAVGPVPSITGVVQPPTEVHVGHANDDTPPRVDVLREAATLITGDRQQDYGSPEVNFQRIADLWNVQLADVLGEGQKFSPYHVALAMVQVKMARAVQSPKRDSFADAAGYIGIAYELSTTEEGSA